MPLQRIDHPQVLHRGRSINCVGPGRHLGDDDALMRYYPEVLPADAEARRLPVLLRAAPHYYNTCAELDALVEALTRLT